MHTKLSNRLRFGIATWLIAVFVAVGFGFSDTSQASSISAADKEAYIKLAAKVPRDASYAALFGNLDKSVGTIDTLLQRYAQTDPTFSYNQMLLSLKGPLGFNPLSAQELGLAGLDVKSGIAAFALQQDTSPLIILTMTDPVKARATLDHVFFQINQSKPVERGERTKVAKMVLYTTTGTKDGAVTVATAYKNKTLLLMLGPESLAQFDSHVDAALALKADTSMEKEKPFLQLLGRLEANTAFVMYNNYAKYLKDLKGSAAKLREQMNKESGDVNAMSPLLFVDQALSLAESFSAQIYAVSLTDHEAGFVHEIIGAPAKIKSFKEIFTIGKKRSFGNLPMAANPIGSIYGTVNIRKLYDRMFGSKPELKNEYSKLNAQLKDESAVDLEKDVYDNLTGEMAGLFYGMSPIPAELATAERVSQAQIASLANLIIVAGLQNPDRGVAVLKAAKAKMDQTGKTVDIVKNRDFSILQHVNADGLDLYMGVRGNLFVLGIGKNSIDSAFGKPGPLNLVESTSVVGHLKMDFSRFVASMDNLKPPAGATNTQLFQQYQMWMTQIAGKMKFFKNAEAKAVEGADGYRTSGRLTY